MRLGTIFGAIALLTSNQKASRNFIVLRIDFYSNQKSPGENFVPFLDICYSFSRLLLFANMGQISSGEQMDAFGDIAYSATKQETQWGGLIDGLTKRSSCSQEGKEEGSGEWECQ